MSRVSPRCTADLKDRAARPDPVPLFIVCQRPECGKVKQVRRPCDQRRQKFCSARCANQGSRNIPPGAASKGGTVRAQRIRERIRARVDAMTPIAAFRQGYELGLQSKHRQQRKRKGLPARSASGFVRGYLLAMQLILQAKGEGLL